jgi:hypothetical protein
MNATLMKNAASTRPTVIRNGTNIRCWASGWRATPATSCAPAMPSPIPAPITRPVRAPAGDDRANKFGVCGHGVSPISGRITEIRRSTTPLMRHLRGRQVCRAVRGVMVALDAHLSSVETKICVTLADCCSDSRPSSAWWLAGPRRRRIHRTVVRLAPGAAPPRRLSRSRTHCWRKRRQLWTKSWTMGLLSSSGFQTTPARLGLTPMTGRKTTPGRW